MRQLPAIFAVAFPLVSLLACKGSGGACVTDAYPPAPAGATTLVHASAGCPEAGADGSAAHPYPTLSAATAQAPRGATVLAAAGTYAENLTLGQDVAIVGPSSPGSRGDQAGIILQAPDPYAVTVTAGATVTLQGFHVLSAKGVGVWAKGGSLTVIASAIEGTTPDAMGQFGYGALSTSNGAIILQDSAVVSSALFGVLMSGATGTVTDCSVSKNHGPGVRVDVASAPVTVEGSDLDANVGFGVGAFSSGAIILQSHITNTALSTPSLDLAIGAGKMGDGIVAGSVHDTAGKDLGAASVKADTNVITGSARVGILCAKGAGGIILQNNTISGTAAAADFGAGIWLQEGAGGMAGNTISANTLSGNRFLGIGLSGDTHGIILQGNHVNGTMLGMTFAGAQQVMIGDGLNLFQGASAAITGNVVGQNGRAGLLLDAETGSATSVSGNTLTDNGVGGIILQNQADMPSIGTNMGQGTMTLTGTMVLGLQTASFSAPQATGG